MEDNSHDQSKNEPYVKVAKPQGKTKTYGRHLVDQSHSRISAEHSFLTDIADVRQMEQGLLQLLDDFHQGKLQAFGENFSLQKMDEVRQRQEKLARTQFELDSQQDPKLHCDSEVATQNMAKLMDNLEELCLSIQNLHNDQVSSEPQANSKK